MADQTRTGSIPAAGIRSGSIAPSKPKVVEPTVLSSEFAVVPSI